MLFSDVNVKSTFEDGVLTEFISGDIDHHNAKAARRRIDREAESYRPRCLILDLSGVNFMDSSGLGLIMGRYALMQRRGGEFLVRSPNERVLEIFRLAGLERMVRIEYENVSERKEGVK